MSLNVYEPVSVFTLMWWLQHCKNSSIIIWIWGSIRPRIFAIYLAKQCFLSRNGEKIFVFCQLNIFFLFGKKVAWWNKFVGDKISEWEKKIVRKNIWLKKFYCDIFFVNRIVVCKKKLSGPAADILVLCPHKQQSVLV